MVDLFAQVCNLGICRSKALKRAAMIGAPGMAGEKSEAGVFLKKDPG
jgi:hypothetical protein